MNERLRKLQLTELEILDEFVRICNKHGLQYYLVGGTLLGAVRHEGFIPWDDDIDVAMLREDYDAFAVICEKELNEKFFYQCPNTDPNYFLSYAKLRKNGTKVYEERFRNARFHTGVFIDIFPFDACPKPGLACHLLYNILAVMNYRGQVDSGEEYKPYTELSGKLGYMLLRLLSPKQILKVRRSLLKLSDWASNGEYLASYSGAYGYRAEVFSSEWFSPAERIAFEQRLLFAPAKMTELLAKLYGENYMIFPPVDERKMHVLSDSISG